ncbi:SDR family oxidoreductase [Cellulomonas shaoxiangyii]|uniref:NAD-dependent epimerase/dehydratase family protein n=1 Tax=Cellulomonas shaoxiangyii TaxID=2566013 RepID=A0A4V1CMC6_9CELL|nr:NAD(P)H-binding protein [Cellulomonas shaoxiangyii]QCB92475.1 NAD-dependent epimerase/dehydratase family protein [Cellulomonas shaoxiangyii]TGY84973.1 NAD-dependent epimerase/dehydratase family protein [Cellulomonas shaoxiangyii]
MTDTVLVTGGTGTLGASVLPLLHAAGVRPRVLSRRPHADTADTTYVVGDTVTGSGLAAAVDGMATVLHMAGGRGDDRAAVQVATAARRAGVRHLVLVSVTAADRIPLGYYRAKAAAEQAVATSGVGWSVLRPAQFHGFVLRTLGRLATLPVVPAPRDLWVEPVDVPAVARQLVEVTLAPPQGRVPDVVGPQVLTGEEVLRALLAARGRSRRVVRVGVPGPVGRACRERANLSGPDALRTGRTWAQFLADRE